MTFVTAAYNAARTLAETIESVLAQTRTDWQMVIVDDGSTDDTAAIAQKYAAADERIAVLSRRNAGTAAARNAGAGVAEGRFLCFLDADDMLEREYVRAQVEFVDRHPGFDIYACNVWVLLRSGERRPMWTGPRVQQVFSLTVEDQLRESSIVLTALVDPRVFESTGGFRDLHSEDYDFWLRAMILGATHVHNPEILAVYRRSEGTKTTFMVAEARSFLEIHQTVADMPELDDRTRDVLRQVVEFDEARLRRREFEEAVLKGDYRDARRRYLRNRRAYPDRLKWLAGAALVLISPGWFARVKTRRMI